MNFIDSVCRYIVSKAANNPSEAVVSSSQDNRAYAPQININALIARNTSWAYAAVNRNANNMSTPILRLYTVKPTSGVKARFRTRKISRNSISYLESKATIQHRMGVGEVEEVLEHPFLDIFRRANRQMEAFTLRHLVGSSLETTGNAYVWKNRNALGTPEELWFLHPQFMKVVADKSNFIRGFEYGTSNNKWFIPVEDMIYFRYADISSPILGVGPLQKTITAIDLSNSMNEHEINLIRRGGAPETVLTIPPEQTVSPKEIKRMKLDFKRHFRGLSNAGKMLVATGGAKLEQFGFSPKEMAYLGGRSWSRSEIYTVFGVPMIFAEVQNVSRANADGANTEYQRQTIVPKLIMIEDTLNEQLVGDFDDTLFVAFDNPVPEDKEFRLKERESNINVGYSTVNEERAQDGLDPIDGGDELRNQAVDITPLEPVKRIKRIPPLGMPAANFIPEEFVDAVQEYLKRFGNAVLAQANDAAFKRAKVANPDDLVSKWFDFTIWDKEAQNTMLPFIRASILLNGPKALAKVGSNRTFDPSSPGVIKLLNERSVVIRGMNRTIQKDTRATIAAGITGGENGGQMRNRIEGVFGFKDKNRAVRIARTETIWALNAGAVEGYKQSGVVEAKEWSTAQDERVCQWCDPMDGKIVSIDQDYFKMGDTFVGRDGGDLGFDIDNVGHPPLHPQCRCSIIPVVRSV